MTRSPIRVLSTLGVAILALAFAADAGAACFTSPSAIPPPGSTALRTPGTLPSATLFSAVSSGQELHLDRPFSGRESIEGMWMVDYLLGDGPDRFDRGLQLFHSGGTETMLSSGLPPVLGNVCVGVWKQTGPRTITLRHMAWNWDANGGLAGTFVMLVRLRLERGGQRFTGTWSADSFDLADNVIPALQVKGVVRATRIGVN